MLMIRLASTVVAATLGMFAIATPSFADDSAASAAPFSLVVMDPLAAPLSCPCVEGYAQRKYEVLAKHLEETLGQPVQVTFAESLEKALAKDSCDHADLVIGKDSVVRAEAGVVGGRVTAVARLTDQQGAATQTGLFVVRSADSAKTLADLSGYRILYGPPECEEKFGAPRALLTESGITVTPAEQAETTSACSDGACKIIEWGESQQAAAVISSYAAPLLEGCGTIDKGDLRVVAESAPVPFITAFVTDRVPKDVAVMLRSALLDAAAYPELLMALESMQGFVDLDDDYLRDYGRRTEAKPNAEELEETSAAPPDAAAWGDFHGPNRNGRVAWLPAELFAKPEVIWQTPLLFPGMGGVAANDRVVLFGDRDPTNNLDAWRCLDAADGSELWTVETPALGKLDYDNQPRATPVIDGNRAFLLGAFGDLLAVDLATGDVLWQVNLRQTFGAEVDLVWGICATPLLVDGALIVTPGAPDASLAALDAETGQPLWQSPGPAHAYASPVLATLGGRRQIVACDREGLGGWDPATGQRLWTLTPPTSGGFNVPTPLVVGDQLLIVGEINGARLHRFGDDGVIDPNPTAIYRKLKPDMSSPVAVGGRVLCCSDQIYCLDAATLAEVWIGGRRDFPSYAPLLATKDRVLTVAKGGELLLLDPLAKKFTVVSRLMPFADAPDVQLFGCPALVGDKLYLRGTDSLVCLSLATNASG